MPIEPAGEGQHAVIVNLPSALLRRMLDDERYSDPLQVLVRHNDSTGEIDVDLRPGPRGTWIPAVLVDGVTVEVRNEGGIREIWAYSE